MIYTGTDESENFEDILRRIMAGIGGVLNPPTAPPANQPPLPPVYSTAGVGGGLTQSNLLMIGLALVVVYLLTR